MRVSSTRPGAVVALLGAAIVLLAGCGGSSHQAAGLPPAVAQLAEKAGAAPVAHAAIGFADEDPKAFSNPYFTLLERRLHVRYARLIIGYGDPGRATAWLRAARAAGLTPYVSLYGEGTCVNPARVAPATGNCPPPTDAAFMQAFERLLRSLPSVHEWGPWNEPSNYRYFPCAAASGSPAPPAGACAQAILSPDQAARYYLDAQRVERALHRHDTLVAGDTGADCTPPDANLCTSDGGATWSGYLPRYVGALGAVHPAVWGTHSYHDLQLRTPLPATETDLLIRFLGAYAGAPTVWLDEEAVWLGGVDGGGVDGDRTAQAAAAREFLELPRVPSARRGQIAREYYYLLRAKPTATFDSALLDLAGAPRPSYCVLIGAPPAACTGNPAAAPIAAPYARR